MSTRFVRRRRTSKNRETAKPVVSEPVAVASSPTISDLEEFLFKAYSFVADNDRVRGHILWIWTDGNRVYAVTDDRYLSNALYHALRALGLSGVRRWSEGEKWIVAYSRELA
jgi:hypothetical protein